MIIVSQIILTHIYMYYIPVDIKLLIIILLMAKYFMLLFNEKYYFRTDLFLSSNFYINLWHDLWLNCCRKQNP